MISAETLRQHPSFAHLTDHQIKILIDLSTEETISAGDFLFHKGAEIHKFYLVVEGQFEIVFETPKLVVEYEMHGQPSHLQMENSIIGTIESGDFLGWSGLVHPFIATSGIRSKKHSKVIAFDCRKLLECFEDDCTFGYYMIQAAAQVIGKRLNDVYKGGEK